MLPPRFFAFHRRCGCTQSHAPAIHIHVDHRRPPQLMNNSSRLCSFSRGNIGITQEGKDQSLVWVVGRICSSDEHLCAISLMTHFRCIPLISEPRNRLPAKPPVHRPPHSQDNCFVFLTATLPVLLFTSAPLTHSRSLPSPSTKSLSSLLFGVCIATRRSTIVSTDGRTTIVRLNKRFRRASTSSNG